MTTPIPTMSQTRNRRAKYFAGAVLTVVLTGLLWANKPWIKSCPRLEPVSWRGINGHLAVRNAANTEILIGTFGEESWPEAIGNIHHFMPSRSIMRWTPNSSRFNVATREEWLAALGTIQVSSHRSIGTHCDRTRKSIIGARIVKEAGSPDGNYVAVVSTNAIPIPGFWPMSGSSLESDLYFHQLYDCGSGNVVGRPLALRSDVRSTAPEICWSSDSKFVFYMSSRWIWIAPAPY